MRKRRQWTSGKGTFDPDDAARVRHTRIGVWDLYEEIIPELRWVPWASRLEQFYEIKTCLPYVWTMVLDIGRLQNCWSLLVAYFGLMALESVLPAVSLWYSGQLLKIIETAVESRSIDKQLLTRIAAGRMICAVLTRLVAHIKSRVSLPLDQRIKAHYGARIFAAYARLDVPTFEDPLVQRRLEAAWSGRSSVAWDTLQGLAQTAQMAVMLVTQVSVLLDVLWNQRDGHVLALLSFASPLLSWWRMKPWKLPGVWAATCRNEYYIRLQGFKQMVAEPAHRKEIVAGNLSSHLLPDYNATQDKVGDEAGEFYELRRKLRFGDRLSSLTLLSEPLREVPQIFFILRAVREPTSLPLSLASLNLIQGTAANFMYMLFGLADQFGSMSEQLDSVRKLYEINDIGNRVVDGLMPFPEDRQQLRRGVSVEFKNVSFRYPGSDEFALRDVSFKIEQGQLCVIVGANGSGKSTVLKLIARLYDATEGEILINGLDIRTLKLEDLRQLISVLFQDYTHFPLSIREDIGLGNPAYLHDNDKIEEAARLGGAHEFIEKLPEGYDTYLDPPVKDIYSGLPEGTKTLFGRTVDHNRLRRMGKMSVTSSTQLSGGQMQRLALSRTFMKSLGRDDEVGLLLFDEPSASLDPAAEHDLFERLRALRGNKTMVFSSHRFGNLTRHADVILYMKDFTIAEMGTHGQLIQQGGGYASIYNMQAQAFLS